MKADYSNNRILIHFLKKGDQKAYSFLVHHHNHGLCVYANSLINNPSIAEDIVQNVFIKVWERRHDLKSNFSIKSFLYKSVYNEFIDQYRKQRSVMVLEKKYIEALDTIVEEEDGSFEKYIALVRKEIKNLPPRCERTFLLSKRDGLTNIEIAEYLNISVKTVESQITKAFTLLRRKLRNDVKGMYFLLFGINSKKVFENRPA